MEAQLFNMFVLSKGIEEDNRQSKRAIQRSKR